MHQAGFQKKMDLNSERYTVAPMAVFVVCFVFCTGGQVADLHENSSVLYDSGLLLLWPHCGVGCMAAWAHGGCDPLWLFVAGGSDSNNRWHDSTVDRFGMLAL